MAAMAGRKLNISGFSANPDGPHFEAGVGPLLSFLPYQGAEGGLWGRGMAGYVDSNLNPGEHVVYRGTVHWIIYLAPVVMLGFGVPLIGSDERFGLILMAAGLIAGAAAYIRQTTSEFAVTNARVIVKTGLLARRTIEINIARVESVQVDQDILGRLFNYGAITVIGTGGTKEPFTMIDNPQQFRRMVQAGQG